MDPVTIVTSALGTAAIAVRLSKTLSDVVTSIGDAPEDVQALQDEVDTVHSAIVHIKGLLEDTEREWSHTWVEDVDKALDRSGDALIKIHVIVSKWKGTGKIGRAGQTWMGFRWTLKDSEVARLMRRLESSKTALLLLIGAGSLDSTGRVGRQVDRVHDMVGSLVAERIADNVKATKDHPSPEHKAPVGLSIEQKRNPSATKHSGFASQSALPDKGPASPEWWSSETSKELVHEDSTRELQQQLSHARGMADMKEAEYQYTITELNKQLVAAKVQSENDHHTMQSSNQRNISLQEKYELLRITCEELVQVKEEQLKVLFTDINTWRAKYEGLAKLYTELRHEHLNMLQKFKAVQLKAASAQGAMDMRDNLQRELRTKNIELLRAQHERDKALSETDKVHSVLDTQEIQIPKGKPLTTFSATEELRLRKLEAQGHKD